jgi:limonene-1,2-epoxide hydrolase
VSAADDRAVVERFWAALYDRDWDRLADCFAPDADYTDVCSPADDIAVGPSQILARLRLGIEPIDRYEHDLKLMVAEGGVVVTEHTETWHWHTGESVALPFVSVQEVAGGLITRWWDYWDLQTLLGAAPEWWITHISAGWGVPSGGAAGTGVPSGEAAGTSAAVPLHSRE